MLTDDYTEFDPTGAPSTVNYLYKPAAAGPGFAGTWESTLPPIDSTFVLQLRSYEDNGLSFINSSEQVARNVKFDRTDHSNFGRRVVEGSTSWARPMDGRALEITGKIRGRITRTEQIERFPDLKTLTMAVHPVGQAEPSIFVFERQ